MGQSASKGLSKAAGKVAAQTPSLKRPPIPSRTPHHASPDNPGTFLRGEGAAAHDVRDRGQEMYLQHVQQQMRQESKKKTNKTSADGTAATKLNQGGNTEMPEDLLKFIQDVGPAKAEIDREFTTSRLLKEENQEELMKGESVRTAKRERRRMPLMQGDENFTTEKNTNFSSQKGSVSLSTPDIHDFGLSNLQLYEMLNEKEEMSDNEKIVGGFHDKVSSEFDEGQQNYSSPKGKELKKKELQLLSQTLTILEIPKLRINEDGDILGLQSSDVPGPEMTTISSIPESKVIMVLKDLLNNPRQSVEGATNKLKLKPEETKT